LKPPILGSEVFFCAFPSWKPFPQRTAASRAYYVTPSRNPSPQGRDLCRNYNNTYYTLSAGPVASLHIISDRKGEPPEGVAAQGS